TQLSLVDRSDARIDRRCVELGQHEHLRRGVDASANRRDVADAVRRLELRAPFAKPLTLGVDIENLAGAVVKPVLARRAAVPGFELAPLVVEVAVGLADPVDD